MMPPDRVAEGKREIESLPKDSAAYRLLKELFDEVGELQTLTLDMAIALQDAWPYIHQWCTIETKKKSISDAMRRATKYHGGR